MLNYPCIHECVKAMFEEYGVKGNSENYKLPETLEDEGIGGELPVELDKLEATLSRLDPVTRVALATHSDEAASILDLDEDSPLNLGYVESFFYTVFYDIHNVDGTPKNFGE